MGEATYYLKAQFPSDQAAKEAEVKFRELLEDLIGLNNSWQQIRNEPGTCAKRKARLIEKHPAAGELIKDIDCDREGKDGGMNCMAGPLPDMSEGFELHVKEDEILLSCYVWHFPKWEALEAWLKEHGAITAGYISDEYVDDYFGMVVMR